MTQHIGQLLLVGGGLLLGLGGLRVAWFGIGLLRGSATMFGEGADRLGSGLRPVETLTPGWHEVIGTAEVSDVGTFEAPFSGDEVVLSRNEIIWEYSAMTGEEADTSRQSWTEIESVPFYVRDDTGTVRAELEEPARYSLDPEKYGADPVTVAERMGLSDVPQEATPGIEEWEASRDFGDRKPDGVVATRYEEGVIEPGDEVFVFGEVVEAEDEGTDDLVMTAGDPDAMRSVVSTEGRKSTSAATFAGSIVGSLLAVGATLLGLGLTLGGLLLVGTGLVGLL